MKLLSIIPLFILAFIATGACNLKNNTKTSMQTENNEPNPQDTVIKKTNEQWKAQLPADVYHIAIEKGTERPFSGKYNDHFDAGTYYCAACGNPLFRSNAKFQSSCGWPSFFEPISKQSIVYLPDNSYGMKRTEVECGRCHAHLGHVFDDGPPPTGLRYCINSVILDFKQAQQAEQDFKNNQQK